VGGVTQRVAPGEVLRFGRSPDAELPLGVEPPDQGISRLADQHVANEADVLSAGPAVRDIAAHMLVHRHLSSGASVDALALRLDDPMWNIMHGKSRNPADPPGTLTCRMYDHQASAQLEQGANLSGWAVFFPEDLPGDPVRGKRMVDTLFPKLQSLAAFWTQGFLAALPLTFLVLVGCFIHYANLHERPFPTWMPHLIFGTVIVGIVYACAFLVYAVFGILGIATPGKKPISYPVRLLRVGLTMLALSTVFFVAFRLTHR